MKIIRFREVIEDNNEKVIKVVNENIERAVMRNAVMFFGDEIEEIEKPVELICDMCSEMYPEYAVIDDVEDVFYISYVVCEECKKKLEEEGV